MPKGHTLSAHLRQSVVNYPSYCVGFEIIFFLKLFKFSKYPFFSNGLIAFFLIPSLNDSMGFFACVTLSLC